MSKKKTVNLRLKNAVLCFGVISTNNFAVSVGAFSLTTAMRFLRSESERLKVGIKYPDHLHPLHRCEQLTEKRFCTVMMLHTVKKIRWDCRKRKECLVRTKLLNYFIAFLRISFATSKFTFTRNHIIKELPLYERLVFVSFSDFVQPLTIIFEIARFSYRTFATEFKGKSRQRYKRKES